MEPRLTIEREPEGETRVTLDAFRKKIDRDLLDLRCVLL
jgi:hypothetical protein